MTLMISGMATISGTVLVLYASIVNPVLTGAIGHILTASIISAPAAILISRIMVPEQKGHQGEDGLKIKSTASSSMDAVVKGTSDGVSLLINVVAMLLVLVALVALTNQILAFLPDFQNEPLTLQRILVSSCACGLADGHPATKLTQPPHSWDQTILNESLPTCNLPDFPPGPCLRVQPLS